MKKFSLSIYLLLSLFFLCATAWAQTESYSDIQVISSDESGITFNYLVPELKTRKVTLDKESFELVDVDKCATSQEPGEPRLPVKIVSLGIPLGSEVEVLVSDMETTKRALNIAPVPVVKEDQTDKLGYKYYYTPASKVYAKDSFFPEGIIVAKPPIFIRDQRVVKLLIFPVQFNPQSKTAQVHKNITIRVNFIGGQKEKGVMAGRDLFENIYKKILLNYEQAKSWRRTEEVKKVLFKPGQNPFDYSNKWYKIKIAEDGVYCLTRADLSNAGITGDIDTAEIRIFNGGGRTLPLDNDSGYLELKEIPLWIKNKNGNQLFDGSDSLFFYGWSCSGWDYDTSKKEFVYSSHPYDSLNTFWLNCEGGFPNPAKRIQEKQSIPGNPDTIVSDFKSREHIEYNSDILKLDGEGHITNYHIWYWYKQSSVSQSRFLPDLVVGRTHKIKVKASSSVSSLSINGSLAQGIGTESKEGDVISKFQSDAFSDATLQTLNINFSSSIYFDWYEIEYWRQLKFQNNYLFFESPDKEGIVEYDISNANDTMVFDISDRFEVERIAGVELDAGADTIKFRDNLASNQKVQYYALESSRIKRPLSIYRDEYSNWRDGNHQADMIIITPEIFYEQVGSLADFRRTYNQFSVERVKLQDIYDEFSGGLTDPLAIRNFLKYTFNNWTKPAPTFALLAGDGHYDYKNYMKTGIPIRIPCFTAYGSWPISDEYYVYFGAAGDLDTNYSGEVDMVISRLPVNSNSELEAALQKIVDYEENPEFESWRNRITLVADDEFSGAQDTTDIGHTMYSEDLANSYIPSHFDISKVYLMEYPLNSVGEKPGANQAIIDAFDEGTLLMNWIGHGNPDLWAHEHVLTKGDVPRLRTNDKLPLVFAATCEVGYFMSPTKQSLGEDLFNTPSKGASAVIAASSLVRPSGNWELNRLFYEIVLSSDRPSLGQALFSAKFLCSPSNTDEMAYVLFGDPAAKLGIPRLRVKINANPDTLSALSLVSINGQVVDSLDNLRSDFNGMVNLVAFDSKREKSHEVVGYGMVNYKLPGRTLFKGTAQVGNGNFQVKFVVPKDISYGGNTARISAYVHDQETDGAGSIESLIVSGSNTSTVDEEGPKIGVNFAGQEKFKEGDYITPDAVMQLTISDTSGINLTGELGHGITLTIDDNSSETDLTHLFQYNAESYTIGSLSYQLPVLSEEEHTFKVKAWDSANNSTLLVTRAKVKSRSGFGILNFMNYPNPFSEQTGFSYELTDDANSVEIKIFTLAGRLIKTIYNCSNTVGYNFRTTWDGKDEDGDRIANGVYICKIEATSAHAVKAEAYMKVIVMH
jgi:hypothetical protein